MSRYELTFTKGANNFQTIFRIPYIKVLFECRGVNCFYRMDNVFIYVVIMIGPIRPKPMIYFQGQCSISEILFKNEGILFMTFVFVLFKSPYFVGYLVR